MPCCHPMPQDLVESITGTGFFAGAFVSGLQISATCTVATTVPSSATTVDQCWIEENGVPGPNHPATLSGNAAASTFVQQVHTLDFRLCYHAYAIPMLDPTSPIEIADCAADLPGGLSGLSTRTETR